MILFKCLRHSFHLFWTIFTEDFAIGHFQRILIHGIQTVNCAETFEAELAVTKFLIWLSETQVECFFVNVYWHSVYS